MFSHAAAVLDIRSVRLCHCTTSKTKDETNNRLRACVNDCRDGAGGGSSHGTRSDMTAKSLWELSIDPKSSDLGKSRFSIYATGPAASPAGMPKHTSKPVPMNRVR